jgi:hypothetical protein
MEIKFPDGSRRVAQPLVGRSIDYAALVAGLVATQAISTTARAEEVAARRWVADQRSHAALLHVFAPRRGERRGGHAALAGSFHLAIASAIASTTGKPE